MPKLLLRSEEEETSTTDIPDEDEPELNEIVAVMTKEGTVTVEIQDFETEEVLASGEIDVSSLGMEPENVWVELSEGAAELSLYIDHLLEDGAEDEVEEMEEELMDSLAPNEMDAPTAEEEEADLMDELDIGLEEAETAEFTAVKPFIGALVPPSDAPEEPDLSAPDADLSLDFVHGYRAHDARDNLRYLLDGRIVYSTAALGVVMDPVSREQQYFTAHDNDIVSLAYHQDRNIVATGQMGKTPSIWVWDASSLEPLIELKGLLQREIVSVDFNEDGTKLVAVGKDNDHTIAVYDLDSGSVIASGSGDKNMVFACKFVPGDDSQLVSCGVKHIKFWSVSPGQLRARRGVTGSKGEIVSMVGLGFKGKFCLSGTASGDLYVWNGNRLAKNIKGIHEGPIFAVNSDADHLYTGGRDGVMQILDARGNPVGKVQFSAPVRSVESDGSKILVGTLNGILETDQECSEPTQIIDAHSGELWGLATHPGDSDVFVTCGDEGRIMMWSATEKTLLKSGNLEAEEARCIAFNHDGSALAVGCRSGAFYILDADLEVAYENFGAHEQAISEIKFSPDDMSLAVGSHDTTVTLWDVHGPDDLDMRARCKGHSSTITHLDWDEDSSMIQTNCLAYELLWWDAFSGDQITSATSMRDTNWHTWTCTLGWPVQAIWDKFAKGCDVKAVDRAKNREVIASGEGVSGLLKLLRYPCTGHGYDNRGRLNMPRPEYKAFTGHSSFVTNARFNADDSKLISVGGLDRSVFQWSTSF